MRGKWQKACLVWFNQKKKQISKSTSHQESLTSTETTKVSCSSTRAIMLTSNYQIDEAFRFLWKCREESTTCEQITKSIELLALSLLKEAAQGQNPQNACCLCPNRVMFGNRAYRLYELSCSPVAICRGHDMPSCWHKSEQHGCCWIHAAGGHQTIVCTF